MPNPRFDVLGLGNAIVDVIAPVDDDFLAKAQLSKIVGGSTPPPYVPPTRCRG